MKQRVAFTLTAELETEQRLELFPIATRLAACLSEELSDNGAERHHVKAFCHIESPASMHNGQLQIQK
jgi:hypothetical protein